MVTPMSVEETMALHGHDGEEAPDPFVPLLYRVIDRRLETSDVATLVLAPVHQRMARFRAGQFNMVSAFGIGEIAISISGPIGGDEPFLEHTVRAVGPVSRALFETPVGAVVGIRGPFGNDWGVDGVGDLDVVIMAGGIGIAPLRGAVLELLERSRSGAGRLSVLIGARSPGDIVFSAEYSGWRSNSIDVAVTVDQAGPEWTGEVGVVTKLVPDAPFRPERAIALLCGPEIMMRFAARALIDRGLDPSRIRVSLERNMQCGIGLCGHCQLGPLLLCRDGPIASYGDVSELMSRREL